MRTLKLLMMTVLLGAGLASCDKEEDIRPSAAVTDPMDPKPTEVGEDQEIGQPMSELENPVDDNEPR